MWGIRALALVTLAAGAGCWSSTQVLTPAASHPGGMGYGTLHHVRGTWLVFAVTEVHTFMTGMAGASGQSDTVLTDGRRLVDGVWRAQPPGWGRTSLSMMFCLGADGSGDCQSVEFDRPPGVSDAGFLSIIDPINRGYTLTIARSTASTAGGGVVTSVTGRGQLTVHDAEDPVEPSLGVWVAPQLGTVFHCAVEAAGPHCRPAMLSGAPMPHGSTLAVQTLRRPDGSRAHVLWETNPFLDGPVRCEVTPAAPIPDCRVARMEER